MADAEPTPRRRRPRTQRERAGMALLMVTTAVAICMVITNEFGTRTTIDSLQAKNNLDQMRAHFLAQSSLNITNLVLRLQKRLDKAAKDMKGSGMQQALPFDLEGVQITEYADSLMGAFGGPADQVEAAIGLPPEDAKGLGLDIGSFRVFIKPIDGKINLNCAKSSGPNQKLLRTQLQFLFYPRAFDPIFEEEDAEGWRRDRKTQIDAIIDYIDDNLDRADTPGAPEDYGYEGLTDKYKAKNRPLDSVSELRLVRGVDDRFWTLFGNSFRVAGSCKVNLRSLDDPKIIISLFSAAAKDENDPLLRNEPYLYALAETVMLGKTFGIYYTEPQEFLDFVKDPMAALAVPDASQAATAATQASAVTNQIPQIVRELGGLELELAKLNQVALSQGVTLYDVEVRGEIDRASSLVPLRRTIHATWDSTWVPQQTSRITTKLPNSEGNNGGWLYLREE